MSFPMPSNPSNTDLLVMMVRVETKLDVALTNIADHETRIRAHSARRWPLPSIAALCAIVGVGTSFVALYR
jgi:hypothetical protein